MVTWSFSGLKDFSNCPRQFNEVKNLKRFVKQATHQMLYGTEVHKALEDYARGVPLASNYARFQSGMDALLAIEGDKYPEQQMALKADMVTPCDFNDPEYHVRGIIDLLIVDKDMAYIVDYKTGNSKYPDVNQLKLMSLFTFAHYPQVMRIKAALFFVMNNVFVDEMYERSDIPRLWAAFRPSLERLSLAHKTNAWVPNPSPLCKWCPVSTCQYYKD